MLGFDRDLLLSKLVLFLLSYSVVSFSQYIFAECTFIMMDVCSAQYQHSAPTLLDPFTMFLYSGSHCFLFLQLVSAPLCWKAGLRL